MSKRKLFTLTGLLLSMSIMLVSCGKNADNSEEADDLNEQQGDEIVLELYSHFGGMDHIIEEFEKANPGIKINLTVFSYNEYENTYKKSLTKEKGDGDLFIIDSNQYGNFNTVKGLEDLLKSEYNAADYKEDFDSELWELGMSLDKTKLLGIPIATAPIVTYYREDIMRQYGFPSDPKELADLMKDKEEWLKIAKTLREDDKYIIQWVGETVKIATADMPYFNENYEYERDNERFSEAVDIARAVKNNGLSPYVDIWSEKGKEMLKNDQFAMLYLGSWGARDLEAMVPEQAGKWRVTSLPFGVYGWNNASIISIAENSTKKEAAWKFIEYYVFKYEDKGRLGNVSGYLPFRNIEENISTTNKFLGGQKEQAFYEDVMSKTNEHQVTPLDGEAFKLWDEVVNEGLENGLSTKDIMNNIRNQVQQQFAKDIEILKKSN